jgi:hypothetical protein
MLFTEGADEQEFQEALDKAQASEIEFQSIIADEGTAISELTTSETKLTIVNEAMDNATLSAKDKELALQHVIDNGDTVLGSYPGYIDRAMDPSRPASYFSIGDNWGQLVGEGKDPWELNKYFLDTRIAAGDRILVSIPKSDIPAGSFLSSEVQYLQQQGYKWVNQWSLAPGH